MIKLENIHPLTDFKRNAKAFVDQIKATKSPIVLTVNGKAEVVIQDAVAFQEMQERLQQAEAELQMLKLQTLRQDLTLGAEQLQTGQYKDYDDDSLAALPETIKSRGRKGDLDEAKLRQLIEQLETIAGIQQGLDELNAGQTRPVSQFAQEMQQKYGISG